MEIIGLTLVLVGIFGLGFTLGKRHERYRWISQNRRNLITDWYGESDCTMMCNADGYHPVQLEAPEWPF
jgi:hypothetical protein